MVPRGEDRGDLGTVFLSGQDGEVEVFGEVSVYSGDFLIPTKQRGRTVFLDSIFHFIRCFVFFHSFVIRALNMFCFSLLAARSGVAGGTPVSLG